MDIKFEIGQLAGETLAMTRDNQPVRMRDGSVMRQPTRKDGGWKSLDTLPSPQKSDVPRTVWLLPREEGFLPRLWVLAPGIDDVPRDQFTHWQDADA